MAWTTLLGTLGIVALLGFIVFAFRQGDKVRRPPQGTPPDSTGGYTP